MTERANVSVRVGDLEWEDQEVPDGVPITRLIRFPTVVPGSAFSALVEFPGGWERPVAGFYESAEEIFVLEGGMVMSGEAMGPGSYGWFPASYLRFESSSPNGATVLAWFSGPARWHRSKSSGDGFIPEEVVIDRGDEMTRVESPLGSGRARLMRAGPRRASYLVDSLGTTRAPSRTFVEMFSAAEGIWAAVAPGEPLPRTLSPTFCRLTEPGPD